MRPALVAHCFHCMMLQTSCDHFFIKKWSHALRLVDDRTTVDADICVRQKAAGVVGPMSQQPPIDGSVQGERWLETTAVCKDNGKYNVNREEEGLLGGLGWRQGRRNVTVNSKYDNHGRYQKASKAPWSPAILPLISPSL